MDRCDGCGKRSKAMTGICLECRKRAKAQILHLADTGCTIGEAGGGWWVWDRLGNVMGQANGRTMAILRSIDVEPVTVPDNDCTTFCEHASILTPNGAGAYCPHCGETME